MYDEDRPTLAECQADEYYLGPTNVPTGGIRCAHCKARHETVADIKWCRDLGEEIRAEAEAEQAAEAASELAFARSLEARAERGGPEPEDSWGEDDDRLTRERLAYEATEARARDERRKADSDWSWEYQNRWGRAENE